MRKALLIVCAIVCSVFYVAAQQLEDVVYLKNGSVVRGTILEQVPGRTLKIMTNDGSQFVCQIIDVQKITKEVATNQNSGYQQSQQYQQPQQHRATTPAKAPAKAPQQKAKIYYKGEINLGYAVASGKSDWEYETEYTDFDGKSGYGSGYYGRYRTNLSRPLFEVINGVQFSKYAYLGVGVGLQYLCGELKDFQSYADYASIINMDYKPASKRWNGVVLPIFANIKVMYEFNNGFAPFLNLGLGGTVGCYSSINCDYRNTGFEFSQKLKGGFYCDFGAGFRYKALNFSVGLLHQTLKGVQEMYNEGSSYGDGYYGDDYYGDDYYGSGSSIGSYKNLKQSISTKFNSFYVKVGVNF